MNCAYCTQTATLRIPAFPETVCCEHAIEFWTGLLTYARDERAAACRLTGAPGEAACNCWTCTQSITSRSVSAAA
jgi:hypothetical protein